MNNITTVFTITKGEKGYNIKSKHYNVYNCYNLKQNELFTTMKHLTDIFNNTLDIGIVFEVV